MVDGGWAVNREQLEQQQPPPPPPPWPQYSPQAAAALGMQALPAKMPPPPGMLPPAAAASLASLPRQQGPQVGTPSSRLQSLGSGSSCRSMPPNLSSV